MAGDTDEKPMLSALRFFGLVRIWASIIIGILVFIVCVVMVFMSYTWESAYVETTAEVTKITCGGVQKTTECKQSGSSNVCVTSERVKCDVEVRYDGQRDGSMSVTYDEGSQPQKGDKLSLFYDKNDPSRIVQYKITSSQRQLMRIIAVVVGVISCFVVIINIVFMRNKTFRTMQGGIGAIDMIGNIVS